MRTLLKLIIPVLAFTALVVFGSEASAQMSHHERVKVTPIKKSGAVIGARIKLTLRPGYNHKRVRIGLGPMTYKKSNDWNGHRAMASDPKKGYLVHQFKEISGLQQNKPLEKKFELRYGQGNKFKGGEKLEVISAWNAGGKDSYWHVWGMQGVHGVKDPGSIITLPKGTAPKPAKPKQPKASSTRSRTRQSTTTSRSRTRQSTTSSRARRSSSSTAR